MLKQSRNESSCKTLIRGVFVNFIRRLSFIDQFFDFSQKSDVLTSCINLFILIFLELVQSSLYLYILSTPSIVIKFKHLNKSHSMCPPFTTMLIILAQSLGILTLFRKCLCEQYTASAQLPFQQHSLFEAMFSQLSNITNNIVLMVGELGPSFFSASPPRDHAGLCQFFFLFYSLT